MMIELFGKLIETDDFGNVFFSQEVVFEEEVMQRLYDAISYHKPSSLGELYQKTKDSALVVCAMDLSNNYVKNKSKYER